MAEQYPNRSDLRNPAQKMAKTVATGQTYGEASQQMRAQQAVPMGSSPTDTPPRVAPGSLGAFNRPTERPDEPVTAGASFGPGRTPTTAFAPPTQDDIVVELRALYAAYPSDELADMLDSYIREGY
jgi:hypothetical protein